MKKLSQIAKQGSRTKRKRQSKFEKLWSRVESLQAQNSRLRTDLHKLVEELDEKVTPVEKAFGTLQREFALKLIDFQRYKSLTGSERRAMRNWVAAICDDLVFTEHFDEELREALARDVANDLDLELDSARNPADQIDDFFKSMAEEEKEQEQQDFENWLKSEVDRCVVKKFGKVDVGDNRMPDMFEDHLNAAKKQRDEEIRAFREALEAELREAHGPEFDDIDVDLETDDPFFDFEFGAGETKANNEAVDGRSLSSDIFKRLFRKTAHALHPDREANEDKQQEKQSLMKVLLDARKNGDLLTVFKLHKQYVGEDTELSAADEKELAKVLEFRIKTLEAEAHAIANESPRHRTAYDSFYAKSRKAREKKINQHIHLVEENRALVESMLATIVNLNTLRAALKQKREAERSFYEFDDFVFDFAD